MVLSSFFSSFIVSCFSLPVYDTDKEGVESFVDTTDFNFVDFVVDGESDLSGALFLSSPIKSPAVSNSQLSSNFSPVSLNLCLLPTLFSNVFSSFDAIFVSFLLSDKSKLEFGKFSFLSPQPLLPPPFRVDGKSGIKNGCAKNAS